MYYDRDFAEVIRAEAMVHHCNVRSILPRLQARAMQHGNLMGSMFYSHEHWWAIIEDIFTSPAVKAMQDEFIKSFLYHDEYALRLSLGTRQTREKLTS